MNAHDYRIGVDVGGTFTDIVFIGKDGEIRTRKVSSSVADYARAIVEGLGDVLEHHRIDPHNIEEIRHGTTIASNAILELKGARTGLITTKGFRDILEIRTMRMPRLYDLTWEKPPDLVERYLRVVVDERVNSKGEIQKHLETADAERAVKHLLNEGVEAIAICLLNSFANPSHERMLKEIVQRLAPDHPCCISYDVLPEIKEYERTSTTVINTYVMPVVARYLLSLKQKLENRRVVAPLLLMQSNGGLTTVDAAINKPMNIIESGPAGGVIGAQAVARTINLPKAITFDMGGTTAKTALIEDGEVARAVEYQVGGGIMVGSRLLTGAGYALKVPAIDLAEVGSGGGSIVWIDGGGLMQVGPQSAGASPGPACYGRGGERPTITDANVILGYINPSYLVGGELRLDADRARHVFEIQIATPLRLTCERAAHGAHLIAASNMIRAIKAVSTERGRDPRECALFAFGGNGPLFAAGMARELGMSRVIVPPSPGLFSSFGLLYAEVEHHYSRTFRRLLRTINCDELNHAWDELVSQASEQLERDGFKGSSIQIRRRASMHYQGQTFELTVPVPNEPLTPGAFSVLEEAFGQEHLRTYGHRAGPEDPVEIVNIMVVGSGIGPRSPMPDRRYVLGDEETERTETRKAYFGSRLGWRETPVLCRRDLQAARPGPCIIEEYDATCLIPPGAKAVLDDHGNIAISL